MKFKIGDQVIITGGKDKGKTGAITKIIPSKNRVVVKGINIYKRHLKSRQGIEGGIISLERPLPTANIAVLDPVHKTPTRIGFQILTDGTKVRIAKKSGAELDKKATPKTTKKKTK